MFSIGISISILAVVALVLLARGKRVGRFLYRMMPKRYMGNGTRIFIYIDGCYNRCATITGITGDDIIIYGRVSVPVDFRGKFYTTAYDKMDGSRFTCVMCRRHYRLVRIAEFLRKWYGWPDEDGQLPVDEFNVSEEGGEDEEQ